MLRLPDAVLQHIVSLVVVTTEEEDEKQSVLKRIKCTSKAMKGIAMAEATRVHRVVTAAYNDLFEKIPTFAMFKDLDNIRVFDNNPLSFIWESPGTKASSFWLMVYYYKQEAKLLIQFSSNAVLMERHLDIMPHSARSGFFKDLSKREILGYSGPLLQFVENWLRSCYETKEWKFSPYTFPM